MVPWSTACPDWEARILARRILVPDLPLFEAEAARADVPLPPPHTLPTTIAGARTGVSEA
ncbi:protein of unknown function [Methylorubrum extorquens]|uniref:Uncharacterized protein n=1 Tax=Methylorubrum extorquens TaxID=408 RepID=A0A2N9AXM9_METEX|nr:hypothetical protein ASF59_01985 [Methylobacterium sp. Leaf121]KQQ07779.1 hypothetical protein ASF56_25055 [Methylobacterium sp. Leaf122]SOR32073.1 protein of unknown function [Methylorubrum extorquens]